MIKKTPDKHTFEVGLIPAAGEGIRAYPSTSMTSKTLFEVGERSLLQRNIELMRDKLGLQKIYIIVGHFASLIKDKLGNGANLGIDIEYIQCRDISAGLAMGIYLAKDIIKSDFVVILGDELYLNSNHEDLLSFSDADFNAVCGVKVTGNIALIKKNYSVQIESDSIVSLIEKPVLVENNFMGCGTYLFTPKIFKYIENTSPSSVTNRVELTDVINNMTKKESGVYPLFLKGRYSNINTIEDLNSTTYIYRSEMYKDYKTSLIIPAYNEEASIGYVIDEFRNSVDEVLVVDNCSVDNTASIAENKGARVLTKKLKGYGDALKYGMDNASGDIFILTEADASFSVGDLPKIVEYLKDCDMVIGTRTTRQMVEQGANMGTVLRWGNVFAAKLVELLWIYLEPRFTDVGCTYRGIWKDAYLNIRDQLIGTGPEFSPEMMVEILRARQKVIEIPVTYRARIGGLSKHSGDLYGICKTAFKMALIVLRKRFNI